MNLSEGPILRPTNPNFSSGPCTKRPGWSPKALENSLIGRSHRSKPGKEKLNKVIQMSRQILGVPDDYLIGIVPASDTGAVEMVLWSVLGCRGVDVLVWESFGALWAADVKQQLKITDLRVLEACYGELPDLSKVNFDNDVLFTWNGTTSGVCIPDGEWIAVDRKGLTICDATSAAFAMKLPWEKLDVVTYSWQKVLGSEAQHGIVILGPRAVERLETYSPKWPLPKIFRLTSGGKLIDGIFRGETINTPSMLAVEDVLDSLKWAEGIGGLDGLIRRTQKNFNAIAQWIENCDEFDFLAQNPLQRSSTSVCILIIAPWFLKFSTYHRLVLLRSLVSLLEEEGTAYDIDSHRSAPPGLRIWAGATVQTSDLELLFPWLEWALREVQFKSRSII